MDIDDFGDLGVQEDFIEDVPKFYHLIFYILSVLSSIIALMTIATILSTQQVKAFDYYHLFHVLGYFILQIVIGANAKKLQPSFPSYMQRMIKLEEHHVCVMLGYVNEVLAYYIFYMTCLISNERFNCIFEHHRYHRIERGGA